MLTVQQPAAGAIASLGKVIENRTWGTQYRGLIAIHAGLREMPDDHPFWEFRPYKTALAAATAHQRDALDHRGTIIALADLVDVHQAEPMSGSWCCEPWGEHGIWSVHWVLENIRPLRTPIKIRGGLGLRGVPGDVASRVLEVAA